MLKIEPVSLTSHAKARWLSSNQYHFALTESFVPLVVAELNRAALNLPVGFMIINNEVVLGAIVGPQVGRNFFIGPGGEWLGSYLPAIYRGYPFFLQKTNDGRKIVCVDTSSVVSSGKKGQLFFDESGKPSHDLARVTEFLTTISENKVLTDKVCALFQQYKLIKPWKFKIQINSEVKEVDGFYCIDQDALNQLPNDEYQKLRESGAIEVSYNQLISMGNLKNLGEMNELYAKLKVDLVSPSSANNLSEGLALNDLLK